MDNNEVYCVQVPSNLIVVDFDIPGSDGKSIEGTHLYYFYTENKEV